MKNNMYGSCIERSRNEMFSDSVVQCSVMSKLKEIDIFIIDTKYIFWFIFFGFTMDGIKFVFSTGTNIPKTEHSELFVFDLFEPGTKS